MSKYGLVQIVERRIERAGSWHGNLIKECLSYWFGCCSGYDELPQHWAHSCGDSTVTNKQVGVAYSEGSPLYTPCWNLSNIMLNSTLLS